MKMTKNKAKPDENLRSFAKVVNVNPRALAHWKHGK